MPNDGVHQDHFLVLDDGIRWISVHGLAHLLRSQPAVWPVGALTVQGTKLRLLARNLCAADQSQYFRMRVALSETRGLLELVEIDAQFRVSK